MPFRSQLFPSVTWLFAAVFPWFSPSRVSLGFAVVFIWFSLGFPLPGFPRVSLGFPWFPCRFYVVFPWFSLVLEPQENSGKTKRKLEENHRKTPEKPGKTREGENHKPPAQGPALALSHIAAHVDMTIDNKCFRSSPGHRRGFKRPLKFA